MTVKDLILVLLIIQQRFCFWRISAELTIRFPPTEADELRRQDNRLIGSDDSLGLVLPTKKGIVTGLPSLDMTKTGHFSASRYRLLQLFNKNPLLQQPNVDELPIDVQIKLMPIKIQDLIERNEVLETTLRMQMTWFDRRLSWDPKTFANLTDAVVPAVSVWSPDIAILNSVNDIYHVIRDKRFEMKIESSGRVWWHPTGILRTYCKLSLLYYPFDKQTCRFTLESPTLDIRFMNLTLRSLETPVDTRMFTPGETWTLIGTNGKNIINRVGSKTFFTRVEFTMYIQRANIYHIINFILPAVILSSIEVLFFMLPATHPQRVGSTTTILLSIIVFQTVVVSQLPKTSTSVPLLSVYIFFVTLVSGLSVSTSVFVAKFAVYAEKRRPFPVWLQKVPYPCDFIRHYCCKGRQAKPSKDIEEAAASLGGTGGHNSDPETTAQDVNKADHLAKRRADFKKKINSQRLQTIRPLFANWNEVSLALDNLLMTIAATTAISSPIVLFILLPMFAKDVVLEHL